MFCGCVDNAGDWVEGLLFFVELLLNIGKEGGSSIVASPCSYILL